MPTYQYRCRACGHEFELRQSFEDDPITVCPSCQEDQVKRVISANGVIFKGSGWYIKDSRSERGRRAGAASTTGATDTEGASAADASSGDEGKTAGTQGGEAASSGSDAGGKAEGKKAATSSSETTSGAGGAEKAGSGT